MNKPTVKLIGRGGNAFSIMATVREALLKAGLDDQAEQYIEEATTGDYDHLLRVTMVYVNVE